MADLLAKYGLLATFYIPRENPERPVMNEADVREIARRFEVGAHTIHHVALAKLPRERVWSEISESKAWVEDVVGQQAISFCYPRGKFTAQTAALVKQAGFLGARTCFLNLNEFPRNPFYWGVSTHAFSHSIFIQLRHALLEQNFKGACDFFRIHKGSTEWRSHFLLALDHVEAQGGIAHLYLHSWEIDKWGDWEKLESVFHSIHERNSLSRVTNGTLFEMWKGRNNGTERERVVGVVRE